MNNSGKDPVTRLLQKDVSLWQESGAAPAFLADGLGWLDAVNWMEKHNPELTSWATQITRSKTIDNVILLGMGGSSLAPEVFFSVFGKQSGHPRLIVVDTTSPAQILDLDADLTRSLIIVASKSGTTVETADLYTYFYTALQRQNGSPGENFVAITDQDSWLHRDAVDKGFMKIFLNPADIGGRYSALSYFGLVPAVLTGVNLSRLLQSVTVFYNSVQSDGADSSVICLARLMADNALVGNNLMHLNIASPLASLAVWIEQLVAESTGKNGMGIIPVYNQSCLDSRNPVPDDFSIGIDYGLQDDPRVKQHADMTWRLVNRYELGSEFLRWEMATALAASVMGINPFDQPNVEEAKHRTRQFVSGHESYSFARLYEDEYFVACLNFPAEKVEKEATVDAVFECFEKLLDGCTYLAVLAYLPNFEEVDQRLGQVRDLLQRRFLTTATLGYGPRYLHSTGQLHKGGPTSGCFIQFIEETEIDIPIPGREYSFADLHRAQADGDYSVLERKGLPIMRITLKGDRLRALDNFAARL